MTLKDIEHIFNRSWVGAFSQKKCIFLFVFLVLSGTFAVLCHAIAAMSGLWVKLVMYFLPGFVISGILLALGVFFARIYYNEVKGASVSYRAVLGRSLKLLVNVAQVALPFILAYLVLWMVMGVFYLIREIPVIGESIGLILSFAPFIIILASLVLSLLSAFTLFLITPHIAFKSSEDDGFIKHVLASFQRHTFSHIVLFIVALAPLLFVAGLLALSANIAQIGLIGSYSVWKSALQWFFMMIPFAAALTPVFLFFFHFSVEGYYLVRKAAKTS